MTQNILWGDYDLQIDDNGVTIINTQNDTRAHYEFDVKEIDKNYAFVEVIGKKGIMKVRLFIKLSDTLFIGFKSGKHVLSITRL